MKKERKHYTPEEKITILRRHLVEGVPISDLCDESGLQPTVFYRWQKEFFENGAAAFEKTSTLQKTAAEKKIAALEEKLQRKNEVVAELMEEHVQLKKSLGELGTEFGFPPIRGIPSWIIFGIGVNGRNCRIDGWWSGSPFLPASISIGVRAMGRSMSTTPGFRGITGWMRRRRGRSSTSTGSIRGKGIGG